jgi:hypothetical protein
MNLYFLFAIASTILFYLQSLEQEVMRITLLCCLISLHLLSLFLLTHLSNQITHIMYDSIRKFGSIPQFERSLGSFQQRLTTWFLIYGGFILYFYITQLVIGWQIQMIWLQFFFQTVTQVIVTQSIHFTT